MAIERRVIIEDDVMFNQEKYQIIIWGDVDKKLILSGGGIKVVQKGDATNLFIQVTGPQRMVSQFERESMNDEVLEEIMDVISKMSSHRHKRL